MKNYEGKYITDFYCDGFFGRRYDLNGSMILHQGKDYIVIRTDNGVVLSANFEEGWQLNEMEQILSQWTKDNY